MLGVRPEPCDAVEAAGVDRPNTYRPWCDWSVIDALCRERSMLLDCNDTDFVTLALRYGGSPPIPPT